MQFERQQAGTPRTTIDSTLGDERHNAHVLAHIIIHDSMHAVADTENNAAYTATSSTQSNLAQTPGP